MTASPGGRRPYTDEEIRKIVRLHDKDELPFNVIAKRLGGFDSANGVPVLTRIQDARFKRIVRPGQTLRVEVSLDDTLDRAFFLTGRVTVDGKSVVRVKFACTQAVAEDAEA